eukprot:3476673-Prorocentrum_lima.AAC.1
MKKLKAFHAQPAGSMASMKASTFITFIFGLCGMNIKRGIPMKINGTSDQSASHDIRSSRIMGLQ